MMPLRFSPDGLILDPTSLHDAPLLAKRAGVGRVLIKDEGERPYGNFKILGGMTAGLRALARATDTRIDMVAARQTGSSKLPRLICASDGNHGLAVAAAAQTAGARATIFLHSGVEKERAARIAALGADIAWTEGTYDDAVDAARTAAMEGDGLLVPDTSADPDDATVRDVMRGYKIMTDELADQFAKADACPTHLFIQAGVGGLAAAVADGLEPCLRLPATLAVVEPATAACVGDALETGRIKRFGGNLHTAAEMLSCGEASAPALSVLRRHRAHAVAVDEARIEDAVRTMEQSGFKTTASGACGLAGLVQAGEDIEVRKRLGLEARSIVLLVVTERK